MYICHALNAYRKHDYDPQLDNIDRKDVGNVGKSGIMYRSLIMLDVCRFLVSSCCRKTEGYLEAVVDEPLESS